MIDSHSDSETAIPSRPTMKTVLLVDDDAKLLRGLARGLAEEPYNLLTAISPAEANVLLSRENVDLVLSDNLMSGALGTDFLVDVGQKYPFIKRIMLSGYIPSTAAQRLIEESGVLKVLTKPCKASVVSLAIREVFAGSDEPPTLDEP